MSAPTSSSSNTVQPSISSPGETPPPSIVAAGTFVPAAPVEPAEPQQAATGPGSGGVVPDQAHKLPFKEQVNGYAKKFAGATFGNEEERKWGEKKLAGEL
ncbi:hypothetical protein L202_06978 [Cryptococcus amylolentus CBS 6039]|uniref:Uncharacterized protein n=2 Tax=Cryptococcus amylolentus TaxID=104669 RepID=A0A1E3HES0_9TREE|nr:hypothetical protein L202_06978 [Cryptococcus amylolentus CBS 6039]ODN74625.1 hypothetical protein L202_06978 [Cryptococcus amylolentus CBS 6039]ODO01582.1 hypothetical protein I350_06402 [Cryptococcus amylolentus CBS 6273]